ncbi:MAG: porin [Giesbergeria sp.]|nr:porin [Giesbergeria sp.]
MSSYSKNGCSSRWGIRGTEDLGGGLKLNFVLEQGIAMDTGGISTVSASNGGFNRNSFVRLSGAFGEIKLGRMLTCL